MNICWFLMILAKKVDYGQKIRFYEKKVGNFSTSKCSKNCAFLFFSKTNFLRVSFRLKKRPPKGFCEKTKRTVFLTIFVNLQKRLETAVLEGHCKCSMKSIICITQPTCFLNNVPSINENFTRQRSFTHIVRLIITLRKFLSKVKLLSAISLFDPRSVSCNKCPECYYQSEYMGKWTLARKLFIDA